MVAKMATDNDLLTEEEMEMLEKLIDKRSIHSVIDAIETICGLKELGSVGGWNDLARAKRWHDLRTPLLTMLDMTHGL